MKTVIERLLSFVKGHLFEPNGKKKNAEKLKRMTTNFFGMSERMTLFQVTFYHFWPICSSNRTPGTQ